MRCCRLPWQRKDRASGIEADGAASQGEGVDTPSLAAIVDDQPWRQEEEVGAGHHFALKMESAKHASCHRVIADEWVHPEDTTK
jgi:hypothetical protein